MRTSPTSNTCRARWMHGLSAGSKRSRR
jgi:hypothetical protein